MPRPCLLGRHLGCCCRPWEAGRWNLPGSRRAAGPPRERPERKAGLSSSGVPSTPSWRSRPAEREGLQGPAAVSTHGAVKGRSGPKAARGPVARTVGTVANKAFSFLLACPLPAAQWHMLPACCLADSAPFTDRLCPLKCSDAAVIRRQPHALDLCPV